MPSVLLTRTLKLPASVHPFESTRKLIFPSSIERSRRIAVPSSLGLRESLRVCAETGIPGRSRAKSTDRNAETSRMRKPPHYTSGNLMSHLDMKAMESPDGE
jgi:hypothetical protein